MITRPTLSFAALAFLLAVSPGCGRPATDEPGGDGTTLDGGASDGGTALDAGASDAGQTSTGCGDAPKNPPNLVANGGFECGLLGWSQQGDAALTADDDARSGHHSAKLVAMGTPANGKFAVTLPLVAASTGKTYCARAFLKGTVASAKLSVLQATSAGVLDTAFSTPVASAGWFAVPNATHFSIPTTVGAKLYFQVVMHAPHLGDTLFIDDVDVWESVYGWCDEQR